MKKIYTIINLSLILLLCQANLFSQTQSKSISQDSTKKIIKQDKGKKKKNLELPDVLIYGKDRTFRKAGNKKNIDKDDVKLIAPTIKYQPEKNELESEQNKDYFQAGLNSKNSRTLASLDYGSYQQFDVRAIHWNQVKNANYSLDGRFKRCDGQFRNNQSSLARVAGQYNAHFSPSFSLLAKGGLEYFNYGLHNAQNGDLQRQNIGEKIQIDTHWSGKTDKSFKFSLYFANNNFEEKDTVDYKNELKERNIGLLSEFKTKFGPTLLNINVGYDFNKLNNRIMPNYSSQKYFQLKSWISYPFKKIFILKPGIIIENIELNDVFSEIQFNPDLELIATPMPTLGFLFKVDKGYQPQNYSNLLEENPYISQFFNFIPMKKRLGMKLKAEYLLKSYISLNTEFDRQDWENYSYLASDSSSKLFNLVPLKNIVKSIWSSSAKFSISPKFNFNIGVILNFYSFKDDSAQNNDSKLPYVEKVCIPFSAEYHVTNTIKTSMAFDWIGPRYISINDGTKLSGHGLLSFEIEKEFDKNISLYAETSNLLNQDNELWENYPGIGFYIEAGIKGTW